MTIRINLRALVVAILVVGAVLCLFLYYSIRSEAVLRYRLTLTMDFDGSVESGSAVQEIRAVWTKPLGFGQETALILRQRGQAIALTSPNGIQLLALMTSRGGNDFARQLLLGCGLLGSGLDPHVMISQIRGFDDFCDVPPKNMPLIIRIDAQSMPIEATRVDPKEVTATLGPGVRIVSMRLQSTHDELSLNLGEQLPWLLDPNRKTFPLAVAKDQSVYSQLGKPEFVKGNF